MDDSYATARLGFVSIDRTLIGSVLPLCLDLKVDAQTRITCESTEADTADPLAFFIRLGLQQALRRPAQTSVSTHLTLTLTNWRQHSLAAGR